MARGGYRPLSGPKKGTKYRPRTKSADTAENKQIREMLALGHKAKAKMYQEFLLRISKNDTLTITEKNLMNKIGAELESAMKESEKPDLDNLDKKDVAASEFLRGVWNDSSVEIAIRVRAAEIVFRNDGEKKGKKDEKSEKARQAGSGKFSAGRPPLTLVKGIKKNP